jgi:hypothetical protein
MLGITQSNFLIAMARQLMIRSGRNVAPELSEELDERLELLMAFEYAFAQPVPEYEPEFRHVRDRLSLHQVAPTASAN